MQTAVLEENASAFVMGHSWFQKWTESFKIGMTEHSLTFKQRRLTLVMVNLDRLNGHFEYSDSNNNNKNFYKSKQILFEGQSRTGWKYFNNEVNANWRMDVTCRNMNYVSQTCPQSTVFCTEFLIANPYQI